MADKATWFSESLARGLKVARAFDREQPKMRISEVAAKTGMTRASARRYLLTLKELGYVGAEGEWFYPLPRILELGYAFVSSARLEEFVEPILQRLSAETDSAAHFAVFDNNETLCLGSVFSQKLFGFFISIGARSRPMRDRWARCCSQVSPAKSSTRISPRCAAWRTPRRR